ncbi:MAG: hypothetical protein AAFZ01_05580 [Pseudomonadota bacterium]
MRFSTEIVRRTVGRIARSISRCVLILAAAFVTIAPFETSHGAPRAALDGPAVRDLVAGARINLHTPIGTRIPVEYGVDGSLAARTSGMAAWYLGAAADTGKWWIKGHRLCQKWTVWFKRETKCVEIRRRGNTFHIKDSDGETGTASIARPGIAAQRHKVATLTPGDALASPAIAEKNQTSPRRLKRAYTLGVAGNSGATEALAPRQRLQLVTRRARADSVAIPRPKAARNALRQARQTARLIPPLPVRASHRVQQVKTSSWSPSRRSKRVRSFRQRKSLRAVFETQR